MNEYPNSVPPPPGNIPPPPPPQWGAPSAGPGPGGGGAVSENRQLFLVLSYFGLFALLPYAMEKNDREVQWHSKHGLVLTGVELVVIIALTVVSFLPVVGCVAMVGSLVFGLAVLGLHVYCIIKALNGERFLIPGISQFADQL